MNTTANAFITLGFSLLLSTSCNSQDKNASSAKTANTNKSKMTTASYREGVDYQVFDRVRILDSKAFTQPVEAYSLLLPKTWKTNGGVFWIGPGQACAGTNMNFKAESTDGQYSLEILPNFLWSWSSNQQLMQFNQSQGSSAYCSYGQPLDAEQYLRQVFVKELRNPSITDIKTNQAVIDEMNSFSEKGRQELMRYGASQVNFRNTANIVNVKWTDGKAGIVMCGVMNIETMVPNVYTGSYDMSYTSTASQRVVFKFPSDKKEEAEKMFTVILGSFRTNPAWKDAVNAYWKGVREQRQREHIGRIRLMDEQTAAIGRSAIEKGNQRLADMDNQLRSWEARQSSQDRMHTNFIKAIREVEHYRDETGKIELSAGYNHAWSRSDGTSYILSNNPNFDPSSVFQDQRWKEMKQVD